MDNTQDIPVNVNPSAAPKAPEPTFDNGPSVVGRKDSKTGWILAIILLLLVAAGGVGFGVWAYMDGNTQKESLNSQISDLRQENENLQGQLSGGGTIINIDTDSEVDTADYIYVGEWGIKIKIPEGLNQVSYLFDSRASESNVEYLYINGLFGESEAVPAFVNTSTQEFWLGVLDRYPSGDAEGVPVGARGTFVVSIGNYDYYYGHPQDVATEGDEREMELKTVSVIQDMLTNVENYSEI